MRGRDRSRPEVGVWVDTALYWLVLAVAAALALTAVVVMLWALPAAADLFGR